MYSKLITREEAADLLGVKPSTISRYWRQGKLSWKVVHRKRRCIYDEVVSLKEANNILSNQNIRDEFIRLKYRVSQLERTLEVLGKKLNMKEAIIFSDTDLKTMYDVAREKDIKKVSLESGMTWATTLSYIGETELYRLQKLVRDPFPWVIFTNFLEELSKHVRKKRNYDKSMSAQQVFLELQYTKENLTKMGRSVFSSSNDTKGLPVEFIDTLKIEEGPAKVETAKLKQKMSVLKKEREKTKPLS